MYDCDNNDRNGTVATQINPNPYPIPLLAYNYIDDQANINDSVF